MLLSPLMSPEYIEPPLELNVNSENLEAGNTEDLEKTNGIEKILKTIAKCVTTKSQRTVIFSKIDHDWVKSLPFFMISTTLLQIAVFAYFWSIYYFQLSFHPYEGMYFYGGCFTSIFTYDPNYPYQLWRWLTNSLNHAGYYHISKNMAVQITLGMAQETAFGFKKIAPLYLGGVVFSQILKLAFSAKAGYGCGASGGDYALIFAQVANLIKNWEDIPYQKVQSVILAAHVLADPIEDFFNYLSDGYLIYAHKLHLFAAIYGLLYGFFIIYYKEEGNKWSGTRMLFLSLYGGVLAIATCYILIFPAPYP
ncbi:unnamed protein product [Caenorhabditis angaria]|uniref:Peptidase S54 rhomboid domain-containing protein n=1 Tax=Caenorhabditis angaria TaxID=860376 RepID=A0A9P1J4U4_9PELO|nr:unnamed protein product [Caenorhabditis angaria]